MPQHALQPVLSGRAHVDGEFGFAVDHRQRGPGQQVVSQPHQDLTVEAVQHQWFGSGTSRALSACVLGVAGSVERD